MEKIHLELKEYSHNVRNQKIVEYLNSQNEDEIKAILKKEFKGYENYFHFAVRFNYVDIVEAFLKHDPDLMEDSLLIFAVKEDLTKMVCTFLQYSKNFDQVTSINSWIIHQVIFNNKQDVIMFVIKKLTRDISLESMLWVAAIYEQTQIARILLRFGADVDFICRNGSALSMAVRYQHIETVNLLLSYGASLKNRCMYGFFPIESPLQEGNNSLFKSMIMQIGL